MVESVNAASRVGALMLSVVIFAAMWESDSPAKPRNHQVASRMSAEQITDSDESLSYDPQRTDNSAELNSLLPTSLIDSRVSTVSLMGHVTSSDALPSGIAPGRYRIVDSDGTIDSILVSEAMAGVKRLIQPRDFYTLRLDNRTRYFIRIESPAETVASAETDDAR